MILAWVAWNTLPWVPRRLRFDPAPFPIMSITVAGGALLQMWVAIRFTLRAERARRRKRHLNLKPIIEQINLIGCANAKIGSDGESDQRII